MLCPYETTSQAGGQLNTQTHSSNFDQSSWIPDTRVTNENVYGARQLFTPNPTFTASGHIWSPKMKCGTKHQQTNINIRLHVLSIIRDLTASTRFHALWV